MSAVPIPGPVAPRPQLLPAAAVLGCFAATAAWRALANGYYVFVIATMALTAIVGIGLNILIGLTGQISFGHVGFYAIGAYAVAMLTTAAKVPFWLAWPVGTRCSPALRARFLRCRGCACSGPYLAMVTIAFGFIVENAAVEWRGLTGGQNGIMNLPRPWLSGEPGERGVALIAIARRGASARRCTGG